ncbi:hypothetical protein HK098_002259 [Nowakowskiella sp. JEL0407]|nr:hypothetical protein HK098_002259 [Nowakowskiella sp. JEL0407]
MSNSQTQKSSIAEKQPTLKNSNSAEFSLPQIKTQPHQQLPSLKKHINFANMNPFQVDSPTKNISSPTENEFKVAHSLSKDFTRLNSLKEDDLANFNYSASLSLPRSKKRSHTNGKPLLNITRSDSNSSNGSNADSGSDLSMPKSQRNYFEESYISKDLDYKFHSVKSARNSIVGCFLADHSNTNLLGEIPHENSSRNQSASSVADNTPNHIIISSGLPQIVRTEMIPKTDITLGKLVTHERSREPSAGGQSRYSTANEISPFKNGLNFADTQNSQKKSSQPRQRAFSESHQISLNNSISERNKRKTVIGTESGSNLNLSTAEFSNMKLLWRSAILSVIRLLKFTSASNDPASDSQKQQQNQQTRRKNVENMLQLYPQKPSDLLIASKISDALSFTTPQLSQTKISILDKILCPKFPALGALKQAHRKEIYNHCSFESVQKNSVLFLKGEKAKVVYLTVYGMVQIHKLNENGEKTVEILKAGEVLGDLICIDSERCWSCSAITFSLCDFLCIDYDVYVRTMILPQTNTQLQEYLKHILKIPAFSTLPDAALQNLLPHATVKKFPANRPIVSESQDLTKIYFVLSGSCKVTKIGKFIERTTLTEDNKLLIFDKNILKVDNGDRVFVRDMEVGEVGFGMVFPDVWNAFPSFVRDKLRSVGNNGRKASLVPPAALFLSEKEAKNLILPLTRCGVTVTPIQPLRCLSFDINVFLQHATIERFNVPVEALQAAYIRKLDEDSLFKS